LARHNHVTAKRSLLGDESCVCYIRPPLEDHEGKFVVIEIVTGAHEMDADELALSDCFPARNPNAQIWLIRGGSCYACRFGRLSAVGQRDSLGRRGKAAALLR
jgi:hypothetical protein